MTQDWWVDVPLWCINIEEAKPLNSLPFHSDSSPTQSEFPRKLKQMNVFPFGVSDSTNFYGVYLSRDDNEEHPIHECILPLRHYRKLIEILSKSLESEQNQDLHSKIDSEFGDFIE